MKKKSGQDYKIIRKFAKKLQAIEFLGGKCEVCGETDLFVLCFHHRNKKEKEGKIATLLYSRSWEAIQKELEKCMLVCHNCHTRIHTDIKKYNKFKEEIQKNLIKNKKKNDLG